MKLKPAFAALIVTAVMSVAIIGCGSSGEDQAGIVNTTTKEAPKSNAPGSENLKLETGAEPARAVGPDGVTPP